MTAELHGDPIDPNVPIVGAAPEYWYPSAPPAYPNYAPQPYFYAQSYYAPPNYDAYSQAGPRRPGEAVSAAVLSLIVAGLLLVSGFILILAVMTVDDPRFEATRQANAVIVAALSNMVTAAVLIVGATLLLGRARAGRPTIGVGTLFCLALGIFWLYEDSISGGSFAWLLIFCGPVITASLLICTARVSNWLRIASPAY
jgi:hypothetical protein